MIFCLVCSQRIFQRIMATSFKRNRTQEYIESEIDPTYDPLDDDRSKRKAFQQKSELFMFSTCQKINIRSYLEQDAYDYLFSAFVSFFNGIQNICENNYSWSTVELYYTMFYLFRTKLHLEGIAIFRASQMYYLDTKNSDKIRTIDKKKYSNTHEGTIKLFEKFFGKTDITYTNTVEYNIPIEWMKEKREIVNYLSVEFLEPKFFPYFEKFSSALKVKESTIKIINDNSFAFQEEFAILGLPLLLFKEIIVDYNINVHKIWAQEKTDYILSKIDQYGLDDIKKYLCM